MAIYLYNGIPLPELPTEVADKVLFIFNSSSNATYRLRWWPANSAIRYDKSTGRISVTMPNTVQPYGYYTETDGVWVQDMNASGGGTLTFANPLNVVWANKNITYTDGSGVYLSASDPIPTPDALSTREPLSLLHGWVMGRKAAKSRRPR